MWKKVGSVHSGDDKSNRSVRSRSRDQFPTQSFHQSVQKMRANTSQLIDNQNTYFCHNHVEKKKRSDGNRSLSRIKTQKQLGQDILKTQISEKKNNLGKSYPHQENQSLITEDKQQEHSNHLVHIQSQQKLKRMAKPSELKELRQDHNKLKQFVKFQINSFRKDFQNVKNQLKFEISYRRQMTEKPQKGQVKDNLVPIVPYRFKSQILDTMNLGPDQTNKKDKKKSQISNQNQLLGKIRNQAARFLEQTRNQYQNQKNSILSKYKDINLEELLA